MKRIALDKAAGHLELAKEAVHQMAGATNFKTYEMAWQDFLSQASRFYSKLEQGSKGCKKSEPWFGGKNTSAKKTRCFPIFTTHATVKNTPLIIPRP